jgi:hypothetical protein
MHHKRSIVLEQFAVPVKSPFAPHVIEFVASSYPVLHVTIQSLPSAAEVQRTPFETDGGLLHVTAMNMNKRYIHEWN